MCEKHWKRRIPPAFGVQSTHTLVQIYKMDKKKGIVSCYSWYAKCSLVTASKCNLYSEKNVCHFAIKFVHKFSANSHVFAIWCCIFLCLLFTAWNICYAKTNKCQEKVKSHDKKLCQPQLRLVTLSKVQQ